MCLTFRWKNSTCFGQFLCPSSRFFTVSTAVVYVIQVCWQLASRIRSELSSVLILLWSCQQICMTYTTAVCTVKNSWWWTEERSEKCRILFQNNFEKLAHLVGFILRAKIYTYYSTLFMQSLYVILLQFCPHVDNFHYYGHVSNVTVIVQNGMWI